MKRFADLSEQEILALSITNEEEDSRIYRGFAEGLRTNYAATAKMFDEMAEEEVRHRTMLYDLYREKFGEFGKTFHGPSTPQIAYIRTLLNSKAGLLTSRRRLPHLP